jgi:oligopeptide/dipeptide ABC transporter ATP-binding protein
MVTLETTEEPPLLSIRELRVRIASDGQEVRAVDGVDLDILPGETVGIVGESGCGKSMTALAVMGLLPWPQARVASGRVVFDGRDLLKLPPREMRALRGDRIAMIFQEPMTSLNPLLTVGRQVAEALEVHRDLGTKAAAAAAVELLARVGIPSPAARAADHPHRLSGGMRQRVMIAMAMACRPRLLIADEPTTALDVTIQAQILDLIEELQRETGAAVLLITHNLGVVAETARRVAVMYAGRVVEQAPTASLFDRPTHPYTAGLIGSVPVLGRRGRDARMRLREIPGMVPALTRDRTGCAFAPRCAWRVAACTDAPPPERSAGPHRVACHVNAPVSA